MHICAHHPVTVCHSRLLLSRPSLRRPLASINAWTLYARTAARRCTRIGCALRRPCAQRPTSAKSASKQAAGAGVGWKQEAAASLVVWNAVCAKSEGPTAGGREWKSSNEDPGLPLFLFQCKARSAQMETANVHCAARRRAPEAEGCLACGKLGIVHGRREPPPGAPGGKERMVCSAVSASQPAI